MTLHWREVNIAGRKYGTLTAVRKFDKRRWVFRCDCGKEMPMQKSQVTIGNIKTCVDCGHKLQNVAITKHGHAKRGADRSEYQTYHAAMQRCNNPKDARYADYGGRGIEFKFDSYMHFFETLGPRPKGLFLDRIDNEKHYEPGNVHWVTPKESAMNRRAHGTRPNLNYHKTA